MKISVKELLEKQGEHSIFAPSYSKTLINCPGSLIPSLLIKEDDKLEAIEGTVAHDVAHKWLQTGFEPVELLGTWDRGIEITTDMFDYLREYIDWCQELGGEQYAETRVDFSDLTPIPNQFGTADHAACFPGELVITDLKFGRRILVSADDNSQLMLYAYGFFKLYDPKYRFKKIVLRIAQPRMGHFDVVEMDRDSFLTRVQSYAPAFKAAWSETAPRRPTIEACEWCKLRATCGARIAAFSLSGVPESVEVGVSIMASIKRSFEMDTFDLWFSDQYELSTAEMAEALKWRKFTNKFFDSIEQELERRAMEDFEEIPGYKIANGRPTRVWADENQAYDSLCGYLEDKEIYTEKMITPNQAEELLVNMGMTRKAVREAVNAMIKYKKGPLGLRPLPKRKNAKRSSDSEAFEDCEE